MVNEITNWSTALGGYFLAMKAANRSPGTIRQHRHYLHYLTDAHRFPWRVTTADLVAIIATDSWGGEAKKSARTVYRGFYKWAHGSGLTDQNPGLALPTVYVPQASPRPTPENLVLRVTNDPSTRVRLMAMLGAFEGLRAAEIAVVHQGDLSGDLLRVHGKGGKIRTVPIMHAALLSELQAVRGWAFPGRTDGHLTPGHVTRLLSEALGVGWTGHTLRHRAATKAYGGTHDLLAVGAMLGHSRPETTQRYVAIDQESVRAALRSAAA